MIEAFRIVTASRAGTAFDGEGARRTGARWNSPGVPMVYTASTRSLAAMELLVHLDQRTVLHSYVCIPVQFNESLVEDLPIGSIPAGWNPTSPTDSTRLVGDAWIKGSSAIILRVPSIVVPEEFNFLLNPLHPDFGKMTLIGKPKPFLYDPRLKKP